LVFGCNISKQADWERWSEILATTISEYHPPLDFFLRGCIMDKVFSTPVTDITNLKSTITRFCYNNWTPVGEHVERNWLSIRHSPCNKRITCWSVLMCCKNTSWVRFWKKKCLYSTYSSFLVINVCNQGKTLCSPCRVLSSLLGN